MKAAERWRVTAKNILNGKRAEYASGSEEFCRQIWGMAQYSEPYPYVDLRLISPRKAKS